MYTWSNRSTTLSGLAFAVASSSRGCFFRPPMPVDAARTTPVIPDGSRDSAGRGRVVLPSLSAEEDGSPPSALLSLLFVLPSSPVAAAVPDGAFDFDDGESTAHSKPRPRNWAATMAAPCSSKLRPQDSDRASAGRGVGRK